MSNHSLILRAANHKTVVVLTSKSELVQALAREFGVDISPYQDHLFDNRWFRFGRGWNISSLADHNPLILSYKSAGPTSVYHS